MTYKDIKEELDVLATREKGDFMFVRRKRDNLAIAVFLVNQRDIEDKNTYQYYIYEQCPPVDFEKTEDFTKLFPADVEINYGDIYEFREAIKKRTWFKFDSIDEKTKKDIYTETEKWMGRNVSYCNAEYIVVGLAVDALDIMWVLANEDMNVACTPCAAPMLPSQEDAEICAEFHKKLQDNWESVNQTLDEFYERFDETVLIARYDMEHDKTVRL